MTGLARTRVTPSMLTARRRLAVHPRPPCSSTSSTGTSGSSSGPARSCSSLGSILDILDGALARAGGKATPFGAFLDSTTDRDRRGVHARRDRARLRARRERDRLGVHVRRVAGSFLVSYTRSKAETLGLKGDVGIGSRAERVVVISPRAGCRPVGRPPVGDLPARGDRLDHRRPADLVRRGKQLRRAGRALRPLDQQAAVAAIEPAAGTRLLDSRSLALRAMLADSTEEGRSGQGALLAEERARPRNAPEEALL